MALKSQGSAVAISNEDADATAYGTATFTAVGEVTDIGEPDGEAADIDVTHLGSAAKEYLTGLPDNGNIQLSANAVTDDAGQLECREAMNAQQRRWIKITWSDGEVQYVKGLIKKMGRSAGTDAKIGLTINVRTSGAWTYVAAP